jgi:solute carrier family 10 (sodium/bile acid cotransporter), member 7
MIFHQVQLVICALIASRLARRAEESSTHLASLEVGEGPSFG